MMYVDSGTEVKTSNGWNRGNMSPEAVKECFYSLEIPEAVFWLCHAVEAFIHTRETDV